MTPEQSPLGKAVVYTEQYDPTLLFPIERKSAREAIGIGARLPFFGTDIWNAYELSWLNRRGKPQIAVATFFVPADSPNIVESKSFKLYLGSFAQTAFDSIDDVRAAIKRDVSAICGANVSVHLAAPYGFRQARDGGIRRVVAGSAGSGYRCLFARSFVAQSGS